MKAVITFEIENCSKCPFHEKHQIITEDSSKYEWGIYCSIVIALKETWSSYTYSGTIMKKLVAADEHPEEYANVPEWCPYITEL